MDARNGHAGRQESGRAAANAAGAGRTGAARPCGRRLRTKVRELRDRAATAASMLLSVTLALNAVASPALASDGGGLFGDGISSTPDLVGDYGDLFGGSSGGSDAADGRGTEGQDGPSLEVEEPAEWRITLDGNGSDNGAPDEVVEATEDGDSVSLPGDAFARDGFHLVGWATTRGNEDVLATESDGEERVAFRNEFVPADARLFNLSYKYVDIGEDEAESLAGAVRMGDGWVLLVSDAVAAGSTDDAGRLVREVDLSYALTGRSLTLYAVWEANSYAIGFDANGGVGEMDGLEASVGEELALPRCEFARDGHGFAGWSLASDGSAGTYDDEATVCDLSTEDGATVTLYAQWREADADEGEEKGGDGAGDDADAGSGGGAAAKSDPAAARPSPDADDSGKGDGGSDEGSDEATPKTANILLDDEGNVAEATVSSLVKGDRAAALDALSGVRGVSGEAKGQAADLLSLRSGDQNIVDGYPRSADGSNIESITLHWMADDGRTPLDDTELVRTPWDDTPTLFQAVVDYALSGEHDYNPGDITITIPAYIFTTRDNRPTGVFSQDSTSLLADPSTATEFNWTRIDDTIVFTNTRRMDAGQTGVITFSYRNIVPHTIVDQTTSSNLEATIRVVTHRGNTMALRSDAITGRIDTFERLLNVSKTVGSHSIVEATQVPAALRNGTDTHYVKVGWSTRAVYNGNQPYDLVAADTLTDEYDGGLSGSSAGSPKSVTKTVYGGYNTLSADYRGSYTSYYPMSQFQADTTYTLMNSVTYTLTERDPAVGDDPRAVTSATATASLRFKWSEPKFLDPPGHFMLNKDGNDGTTGDYMAHSKTNSRCQDIKVDNQDGWYGLYPSALNKLDKGEDVEVAYTTQSIGYMLPWTCEGDPRVLSNYGKRAVTMVTYDTDEMAANAMFEGLTNELYNYETPIGTGLTRGDDYELVAVEFPATPVIRKAKAINLKPDGTFESMFVGDGSVDYELDSAASHIPPITLSAKVNGTWVDLATADWSSGSLVITPEAGVTVSGSRVSLPAGCEQWRTTVEASNAGLSYYVRTIVSLKADGKLGDIAADLFAQDIAVPRSYVCNTARMDVFDADGNTLVNFHKYAYDEVRGYTTKIGVSPTKRVAWERDLRNRQIRLRYTATAEEQSVITDSHTYEEAVADGEIVPETSCIWYDLLPRAVVPDLGTIRLRGGDRVTDIQTIPNWRGTGRTMLIVEATLSPRITQYLSAEDNVRYCEDIPKISFEATYDIDDYQTFGASLHNVIAFESTAKEEIGTIPNRCGEYDSPAGRRNMYTERACADSTEVLALTGLDPSREGSRFVYAGVSLNVSSEFDASTSLHKDIQVNADGRWSQGTYDDKRTVYEGGQYAYRLRMMSSAHTTSKNLILYDSLENYYAVDGNDPADINAPRWRGTLVDVDMNGLTFKGCAPVLYYSCVDNLILSDENDPRVANPTNMDLTNSSIWVRADEYQGSLADVHALAIDASKAADGTDFELPALEQVMVIVNMRAPEGQPAREAVAADAHAYNNIYLMSTSVDTDHGNIEHTNNFIRNDYTKVGLVEYSVTVKKAWEDGDNRDGIRPSSVTVQLLSDGTPIGSPVQLSDENAWQYKFEHLPYTDGTGRKIKYTPSEVAVNGYGSQSFAADQQTTIVNTHEPERISLAGEKTWVGDTDEVRPPSITIELLANGRKVATQRVTPDDGGNWTYVFEDMFKNENGQPIEYTVRETGANSYIPSFGGEDGISITNTYHPFGDLSISKVTQGVTEDFANRGYDVMVRLYDANGDELDGEFDYETTLNLTGTVRSGGIISLHDGETATISEIPENSTYHIEEAVPAGFSVSYTNHNGTILPNMTKACRIRNTYSASGFVNLRVRKTLDGREMNRYAFRFQLLDEDGNQLRLAYNEADGSVVFGALNYTEADAGNTYTYSIIEADRERPGYTYDHGKTYVDVAVEDNGDGTLTVTPTYRTVSASGNGMNILRGTAMGNGLVATTGEATWAAAGWTATGATGTEVADADGAPSETIAKMVSLPSGTASVIQRDVPLTGGETYTLSGYARLASGGTATGAFGIYDEQGQTWAGRATPAIGDDEWEAFSTTITVPDGDDKPWRVVFGKNGTAAVDLCGLRLEAGEEATPYDAYESAGPAAFANAYRAEGSITLRAWKQLQGGRGVESGEFTFELCDEDGNVVKTATNDASGKIVFPEIEYDQYDAGHTYHYIVRERRGSDKTITYDDSSFGYSVEVVDNGDGTLTCSTGYVSVNPIMERLAAEDLDMEERAQYSWISSDEDALVGQSANNAFIAFDFTSDTSTFANITPPDNWASMSDEQQTQFIIEQFDICGGISRCLGADLDADDLTNATFNSEDGIWVFYLVPTETGWAKIESTINDAITIEHDMNSSYFELVMLPSASPASASALEFIDRMAECFVTGTPVVTGYDIDASEEGEIPVFVNEEKPGSLSITKAVTYETPEEKKHEDFTFLVKLSGPNLPDTIDYELERYTAPMTLFAVAVDADTGNEIEAEFSGLGEHWGADGDAILRLESYPDGYYPTGRVHDLSNDTWIECDNWYDPHIVVSADTTGVHEYEFELEQGAAGLLGELTWRVQDGTLEIFPTNGVSGTYYGQGFSTSSIPWYSLRDEITEIVVRPESKIVGDASYLFAYLSNAETADVSGLDLTEATNISGMFYNDSSLTDVDFGDWDIPRVSNASYMFSGCSSLRDVDLTSWSAMPANIGSFFGNCSLDSLDASGLTVDFANCSNLFKNVTDLTAANCTFINTGSSSFSSNPFSNDLQHIVLDGSDLSAAPAVGSADYGLFKGKTQLVSASLRNCKLANPTIMYAMFSGDTALETVDLTGVDTTGATTTQQMFYNCGSLASVAGANDIDSASLRTVGGMFYGCASLTGTLDLSGMTENLTITRNGIQNMVSGTDIETLNISGITTDSSCNWFMGTAFQNNNNLKHVIMRDANLGTASELFSDSPSSLQTIDLTNTTISYTAWQMFETCKCTTVNLTNVKFQEGIPCTEMFISANNLSNLILDGIQLQPSSLLSAFYGCNSLEELDLSGLDMSACSSVAHAFSSCSALTSLDLSSWDTLPSDCKMDFIFSGCTSLTELDLSALDMTDRTYDDVKDMFDRSSIQKITLGTNWAFPSDGSGHQLTLPQGNWTNGTVTLPEAALAQQWTSSMAGTWTKVVDSGSSGSGIALAVIGHLLGALSDVLMPTTAYATTAGWNAAPDHDGVHNPYEWRIDENGVLTIRPEDGAAESTITMHDSWPWTYNNTVKSVLFDGTLHIDIPSDQTGLQSMFEYCSNLEEIDLHGLDIISSKSLAYFFDYNSKLTTIYGLNELDISSVTDISEMFEGCSSIEEIDMSGMDTSHITNMHATLGYCNNLRRVNISGWDCRQAPTSEPFSYSTNIETIDASNVKLAGGMHPFKSLSHLQTVNLEGANTSEMTTMSYWFYECYALETIQGIEDLDISGVTNMQSLFYQCQALTSLDLSNWDVSQVTTMTGMFFGCVNLLSLDISGWDMRGIHGSGDSPFYQSDTSDDSYLKTIICSNIALPPLSSYFFAGRSRTEEILGGNWDMSSVAEAQYMFLNSYALKRLKASAQTTAGASGTIAYDLVSNAPHLEYADFSGWSINKKSNSTALIGSNLGSSSSSCEISFRNAVIRNAVGYLFSESDYSAGITTLDLRGVQWVNLTDASYMFAGQTALTTIKGLSDIDTSKVTTVSRAFQNCNSLGPVIDLSAWDTANLQYAQSVFVRSTPLDTLNLSGWDFSQVVGGVSGVSFPSAQATHIIMENCTLSGMSSAFSGCTRTETISLKNSDARLCHTTYQTFAGCSALVSVDLSNLDTSNITAMPYMFVGCSSLTSLDLRSFDTSRVTDMYAMFSGCTSLENIDVSSFDTSRVTDFRSMFATCSALRELDLENFAVSAGANTGGIFSDASNLQKLVLGSASVFNNSELVTPPNDAPYDGLWLQLESLDTFDAEDVGPTANGTYVWDTQPKYIVAYDPNGGIGSISRNRHMPDEQFEIESCSYTMYDQDFAGWNTAADGSGTTYESGQAVSNIGVNGEVVTLYAQWTQRSHTVELDEGTFTVTVPAGSTLTLPDLPAGTSYQIYEQSQGGWVLVGTSETSGTISPLETSEARFTNDWQPLRASVQIIGQKNLDDNAAAAGSFSFELLEDGQVIQTKRNASGGGVMFDPIVYRNVGEHDYVICEVVDDSDSDTIYDTHEAHVHVSVTEEKGVMIASIDQDDDDLVFENYTKPSTLRVIKDISGETSASVDDEFTFSVRLTDGTGKPISDAHVTKSPASNGSGGSGITAGGIASVIDWLISAVAPTRADAATTTATITFDAGNGTFPGGGQTNSVVMSQRTESQTVSTANINANGVATRALTVNDQGYQTVNMTWADTVTADMWFGTYSTSYSWAAVYPPTTTPSRTNYSSATISNGKLGGGNSRGAYTKPTSQSYHKVYDLPDKGARFAFYMGTTSSSPSSYYTTGYGYRAVVTGKKTGVTSGTISDPVSNDAALAFSKWVDGNGDPVDVNTMEITQDVTLYASYIPIERSGKAYAVLDSSGSFVLCRSSNDYLNATNGTLVDVYGNSRTGRIFQIDEEGLPTSSPWSSYARSIKTVSVAANQIISPVSCCRWFYNCSNCTNVSLSGLDTSRTTTMSHMFDNCSAVQTLDLSTLDTSNVTDMSYMFNYCSALRTLDINGWDTSHVRTMLYMFYYCRNLSSLDTSKLNVSSVTNMGYMFAYCRMERMAFPTWDTSSVNSMYNMFYYHEASELDVSTFDMSQVSSLTDMFRNATKLRKIKLGDKFKFVDGSSGNPLPEPTAPDAAKRWYNSDLDTDGYTPSELAQQYDASLAGTWEWYHVEYDIAYDANGGLGDAADDHVVYETAVTLPNAPFTRPGYDMSGWNTQPDGSGDAYANGAKVRNLTVVNGDTVTFYAQWTDKHYKVVFDKNGAFLGAMGKQEMVRNTPEELDACGFIRPGYTFDGWDTSADGTGTHYDDGEEIVNLCLDEPEITLYAQWRRYSDPAIAGDAEGVYTITLKGGEHADFEGLPAGASYEVVETGIPSGWAQASASGTAGTLAADETATASFSNRYATTGEAVIETFKSLVGREIGTGEFAFELLDGEGTVLETATNDMLLSGDSPHAGQAPVTFSPLSYDQEGTWHYTIREAAGDDATVDYSETIVPVTVTMTDKGHGQLGATVTYGSGDNDDSFENRVKPGALEIRKVTSRTSYASWDKSFAFDVSLSDSLGNPLSTDALTITKIDRAGSESEEEGSVEGGRMTVSMRGGESVTIAGLPHGATYSVSEQDASGWTLAESSGTTGTIAATQTSEATFDNEYWAEGTFSVSGTKVLTGRPLVAGEFTFELVDPDGGVVASATNAADGSFTFANLDIQEGWVGATRTYHVRERTGGVAHVTYDGHVEDVTVTFSDDGLGHLSAAVSYDASGCSFLNAYALSMPQVGGPGLAQASAAVAMVVTCLAALEIGRRRLMRGRNER